MDEDGSLKLTDTYNMDVSYGLIGLKEDIFLYSCKSLDHKAAIMALQHK